MSQRARSASRASDARGCRASKNATCAAFAGHRVPTGHQPCASKYRHVRGNRARSRESRPRSRDIHGIYDASCPPLAASSRDVRAVRAVRVSPVATSISRHPVFSGCTISAIPPDAMSRAAYGRAHSRKSFAVLGVRPKTRTNASSTRRVASSGSSGKEKASGKEKRSFSRRARSARRRLISLARRAPSSVSERRRNQLRSLGLQLS